jgi:predicted lipoprotein
MRRAVLLLPIACLSNCVPWTVRPLDDGRKVSLERFDASRYADEVWTAKLMPAIDSAAVDLGELLSRGALKPGEHAAVKGSAVVLEVNLSPPAGALRLDLLPADGRADALLQIGPEMRGTSLRDATPVVSFSQFVNQMDFASAGTELNRRAARALPPQVELVKARGRRLEFTGTFTLVNGELPRIVPVRIHWAGDGK